MNAALRISILLNLGLAFFCICLLSDEKKGGASKLDSFSGSETGSGVQRTNVPDHGFLASSGEDYAVFRWSQLESTDYRVYMKNLRAIGCPDQTIQDIITADVHGLYRRQRQELGRKLNLLVNTSLSIGLNQRALLEAELRRLPAEEEAVLAALLGAGPTLLDVASSELEPPPRCQPGKQAVLMPLVFADVDLSALRLDKTRIEPVINCLRRRFTDQLSGLSQDPSDPAYLAMWQQAQPEIDSMLKGMIGINAFRQYEVAANAGLRNKQASAR